MVHQFRLVHLDHSVIFAMPEIIWPVHSAWHAAVFSDRSVYPVAR